MLSDIRVVDLTRLLPGPYATWLLAGMGADVVKVEQPGKGDYIRANYPRRAGASNVFHLFNRGKRLVAANLKQDEGRQVLWDLLAGADILIEGFRPGVMERLGFSWTDVHERCPSLVYCSLSGFGQDTPYRRRVAHDINYLSIAGLQGGLRDESGHPVPARFQIADMAGGALTAVVGILGAVHEAKSKGEGRFVDVSMTDAVFPFQGLRLAEELMPGERAPEAWGREEGHDKELGTYRTSDGRYISLDPYEQHFKDRLWTVLEQDGLTSRPGPEATREEVRAQLRDVVAQRTRAHWVELLADEEVCFAPVYDLPELALDPHIAHRGLLGDALDPDVKSPTLGFPLKFDPPLGTREVRPWQVGAETRTVLAELGWDDARVQAAADSGAIEIAEG